MDKPLDEAEIRVLGSLVEKQITTPEYYPLSLNALVNACNQSSNRDPVVSYDEKTVYQALEDLRQKNLAYVFYGSESRVPRYKHVMPEIFHLNPEETSVLCVLMLRGPQTTGELRTRTGRLHEFADLGEIERTLEGLIRHDEGALVKRLSRRPSQKEARYTHLLLGDEATEDEPPMIANLEPRVVRETSRLESLEAEIASLRNEMEVLRGEFERFKSQF